MNGEELNRRYHELCGWKTSRQFMNEYRTETYDFWHRPDCNETTAHTVHFGINAMDGSGCRSHLPRLDKDANLAIAAAMRVFSNGFDVGYTPNESGIGLQWSFCRMEDLHKSISAGHDGPTLCEAILKALIAAREGR